MTASVFVIQPFRSLYDDYYEKIYAPAIEDTGRTARRGDSIFRAGNVVSQVVEEIALAEVILAELSEPNANVYYELGIAHALSKPCVLVTSKTDEIPFDLRSQRHIGYAVTSPDWAAALRADVTAAINETAADPSSSTLLPLQFAGQRPPEEGVDDRQATVVVGALAMLQSSIDSLRVEQATFAGLAPREMGVATARELKADATTLLADGLAPDRVVEALRARGAPTVWAEHVVHQLTARVI